MFKNILLIFCFLFVSLYSQDLTGFTSKSDSLSKLFKHQEALDVINEGLKKFPDNWELNWRLSRTYVDLGENMPGETDEQKDAQVAVYEKALAAADKSVKAAPGHTEPYLRRAIANARIALFKGVFSVADVVNQVKADCEKAIELNNAEKELMAVAHYILARTHSTISEKWAPARSVLGLGWAEYDSSIVHFKKAESLYPGFMMIHLDYAKTLLREDEYETALKELKKADSCNLIDEDDSKRKAEVKKLIAEVEEELD